MSIYQSITSDTGVATYDYVSSTGGTMNITASLTATGVYNSSTSNNISITVTSFTADIYVSPTGSDSNNGLTQSTAVATISKAVELVSSGGTIGLLDGTYTNNVVIRKACTIKGQSKSGVIIDGNNNSNSINFNIDSTFIISNCTLKSLNFGILNYGTMIVTNCHFESNNTGILNYRTITVTNCTFKTNINYSIDNRSTANLHCNTYIPSSTPKLNNCTEGSCP